MAVFADNTFVFTRWRLMSYMRMTEYTKGKLISFTIAQSKCAKNVTLLINQ